MKLGCVGDQMTKQECRPQMRTGQLPQGKLGDSPPETGRADYHTLCQAIEEDRLLIPTVNHYVQYGDQGTIGRTAEGGVIVQDNGGILMMAAETGMDEEIDEMLRDLAHLHRAETQQAQESVAFWSKVDIKLSQRAIGFEVATMYKTKDKKVQPVHDSTVKPHAVEGRLDWQMRARARQPANNNQSWRQFGKYIEDRTATFPLGSRVTSERLRKMKIAGWLWPRESEMLQEVFFCREAALSFDFQESGRIHHDVYPPVRINTVPHTAWKEGNFPVPRKLRDEVGRMIQERLDRGVLEYSKSPYSNPWFLVKKKDQGFRLINNAQRINGVTVRDANLPPNPDEFSEEFAGCQVVSLIDFFSGYDQVELHPISRPLTAFFTPTHGLVQQCTLPMGTTNSVAEFVRVVTKILQDLVPHCCMPYMDDIAVKGPKTDYAGELLEPGIRRFIGEHIVNIDRVLRNLEMAGATASGLKSDWCYDSMGVVGYVVDKHGRHPADKKVRKITEWPPCTSPRDVRMFVGLCVYYRIWIEGFAIIAAPLFDLLRKDANFQWTIEASDAMSRLKHCLTSAPALVSIDYSEPMRLVVISVDGSKKGWGAVIQQEDSMGRRHPVRYESGVWSTAERNWDSGKHECKALLLALKKFRPWIYGIHFVVETDARTLVDQLNRSATDLPGALITRWLALLNMWEFEVRHVEGKRNTVADALSRRPEQPGWQPPEEAEDDVEDFIDKHLGALSLSTNVSMDHWDPQYSHHVTTMDMGVLRSLHTEHFRNIAQWLLTMKNPSNLNRSELRKLRRAALKFAVIENILWAKASAGKPLRRVVDHPLEQTKIISELHDESGHRGREGTWRKVWYRYFWPKMFDHVEQYVKTCEQCQLHASRKFDEELHPTVGPNGPWEWITMDVVYMPDGTGGRKYLVVARDYMSGYPEAKGLTNNDSVSVARFLEQTVFARWGVPLKMSVDGGPENRGLVQELAKLYGINRVVASAFHPQAQGLIERGHKELVGALRKMTGNWVTNLHLALWADRVTVKRSTGETPAFLISGREHVLPIELQVRTWQTLPWDTVRDTETLLALRAKQFEHRDDRLKEAVDRTVRLREMNKAWFDAKANLRPSPMEPGDMVLVRDVIGDLDMSRNQKLRPRWKGPFRISQASEKGTYLLEELDGTPLKATYAGNRVTRFYQRGTLENAIVTDQTPKGPEPLQPPNGPLGARLTPVPAAIRRTSRRIGMRQEQHAPQSTDRSHQQVEVRMPAPMTPGRRADYEVFDRINEDEDADLG
jgi:hypothetical protein